MVLRGAPFQSVTRGDRWEKAIRGCLFAGKHPPKTWLLLFHGVPKDARFSLSSCRSCSPGRQAPHNHSVPAAIPDTCPGHRRLWRDKNKGGVQAPLLCNQSVPGLGRMDRVLHSLVSNPQFWMTFSCKEILWNSLWNYLKGRELRVCKAYIDTRTKNHYCVSIKNVVSYL